MTASCSESLTLGTAPFDPLILIDSGLSNEHLKRDQWITTTGDVNFDASIRFAVAPALNPSLMRTFQGLQETKAVLFEEMCDVSICPVV